VIWTLWPPLVAGYARTARFAAAGGFASPSLADASGIGCATAPTPRTPSSRPGPRERAASTVYPLPASAACSARRVSGSPPESRFARRSAAISAARSRAAASTRASARGTS
jgi:hypothetical protein